MSRPYARNRSRILLDAFIEWLGQPRSFPWIVLLLSVAYVARYYVPLSRRILLWDDFMHFSHGAGNELFLQHWFHTYLHFVPMLKLTYFAFIRLVPLQSLPAATSVWTLFWVAWFSGTFLRLCHFYRIHHLAACAGLAYVLFNPMFSEVQIWFCSSFYLVGLVLAMEGLLQVEYAIASQKNCGGLQLTTFPDFACSRPLLISSNASLFLNSQAS